MQIERTIRGLGPSAVVALCALLCACPSEPAEVTELPAARRLSALEYNHCIEDLFPDAAIPYFDFAPDPVVDGLDNNAELLTSSPILVEQYQRAAKQIASSVVFDLPAGCGDAPEECGRTVAADIGLPIFRRPLTEAELDAFGAFFAEESATAGINVASQLLVSVLLQSPAFLFRLELDRGLPPTDDGLVPLDPYEQASRLSFLLWSSTPDAALLAAAADGSLATPDGVAEQVARMLADPKARRGLRTFHEQWLDVRRLQTIGKDDIRYPWWTGELLTAMEEEPGRFADHVVFDGEGTLEALLTSNEAPIESTLAGLYGAEAPPDGEWALVALDPDERAGILTQGNFLAGHGHLVHPSPVLRGKFVLERLLCAPVGTPGADVDTSPPTVEEFPEPTTNRERYAQHATDAECAVCHDAMDPIGFGFEGYDTTGAVRTEDNGFPIDDSGALSGTDVDGEFAGAVELAHILAGSEQVRLCYSTHWLRWAFGRTDTPVDEEFIDAVTAKASESGALDVQELVTAIATSPTYTHRGVVGGDE